MPLSTLRFFTKVETIRLGVKEKICFTIGFGNVNWRLRSDVRWQTVTDVGDENAQSSSMDSLIKQTIKFSNDAKSSFRQFFKVSWRTEFITMISCMDWSYAVTAKVGPLTCGQFVLKLSTSTNHHWHKANGTHHACACWTSGFSTQETGFSGPVPVFSGLMFHY